MIRRTCCTIGQYRTALGSTDMTHSLSDEIGGLELDIQLLVSRIIKIVLLLDLGTSKYLRTSSTEPSLRILPALEPA